jgi:hypothetical protein
MSNVTLFHRTRTPEAAHEILREGFRDVTSYMNGADVTGVWLSDMPLDASTILELQGLLLAVTLPAEVIEPYDSVLHGWAGWRRRRSVSMLRISPSCRTNTILTVATTFRGRSGG